MNPYGRPKVADKAKMTPICLYERQREHVKKMGGSKYVRELIERDMKENPPGYESEKPQESAKNSAVDSVLIHRLKGLSQNFTP